MANWFMSDIRRQPFPQKDGLSEEVSGQAWVFAIPSASDLTAQLNVLNG
jgi:hypothetical protein